MTVLVPILSAFVGAVLGFGFNWWLTRRNQQHERQLAVFNVEVEELKSQLALVNRAYRTLYENLWIQEDRIADGDRYSTADALEAVKEATAVYRALRVPYLTTSDLFNIRWSRFVEAFTRAYSDLGEDDYQIPLDFGTSLERFNAAHAEVTALIRHGLANFKKGKPVYPGTPEELLPGYGHSTQQRQSR